MTLDCPSTGSLNKAGGSTRSPPSSQSLPTVAHERETEPGPTVQHIPTIEAVQELEGIGALSSIAMHYSAGRPEAKANAGLSRRWPRGEAAAMRPRPPLRRQPFEA